MADDDAIEEGRRPLTRAEEREAAAKRMEQQSTWVDLQIRQAINRGDFENLPGFGKPLAGLGEEHDPDWWVRQLIEREQITGVLPPSLQLRKEDAALDATLDRLSRAEDVRTAVDEFNARVRWALYRPPEGPPVTTPQRDPEVEITRWEERRQARRAERGAGGAGASGRKRPQRRRRRDRRD